MLKKHMLFAVAALSSLTACSTVPAEFRQPGTVLSMTPSVMPLEEAIAQRVVKPTSRADFAKLPEANCSEQITQKPAYATGSPKNQETVDVLHVLCTADSPKYVRVNMVTVRLQNGKVLAPAPFHYKVPIAVGDAIKVDTIWDRIAH